MAYVNSQRIVQGLVVALRANTSLRTALIGGIHEGFSAEDLSYPFCVYVVVAAPLADDHTGRTTVMLVDVTVYSRSQVEASNLDESITNTLEGASLTVSGQTTLICYRVTDLRMTDVDEEGQKVYGAGGSYEIWTAQKPT